MWHAPTLPLPVATFFKSSSSESKSSFSQPCMRFLGRNGLRVTGGCTGAPPCLGVSKISRKSGRTCEACEGFKVLTSCLQGVPGDSIASPTHSFHHSYCSRGAAIGHDIGTATLHGMRRIGGYALRSSCSPPPCLRSFNSRGFTPCRLLRDTARLRAVLLQALLHTPHCALR